MNNLKRLLPLALLVLILAFLILAKARLAETPVTSLLQNKNEIPILMYHKVNPYSSSGGYGLRVPPKLFAWQMSYLKKRGFATISFNDLYDHWENGAPLPPRPVIITFDDGYQDNYKFAYPILKARKLRATIFLVSGLIGQTNAWDTKDHRHPVNRLLNWSQIKEMDRNGIEFGAHTVTHPNLTRIPPAQAASEIRLCKQTLEKELGHPIYTFAYPYGHFNNTIKNETAKAGFKAAVTTKVAKNSLLPKDHFTLKRLRITGYTHNEDFVRMIEK